MLTRVKDKYKELLCVSFLLKGLFLHVLAPVFGYLQFIKNRRVHTFIYPLLGLIGYGIIHSLVNYSTESLVRLSQLLGLALLFSYGLENRAKIDFESIAKLILILGVGVLIYDIFIGTTLFQKPILGFRLPRYRGLLREYNFSAAAYLGALLLILKSKKYSFYLLALGLIISTGSRAALLSLIVLVAVVVIKNKYFHKAIILATLLYPLFVFSTFYMPNELLQRINNVSSKRLAIQRATFEILKEKPFGAGYFKGRKELEEYKKNSPHRYASLEPHNLIQQIIFEFGIGSLILLIPFIVWIYRLQGLLGNLAVMCVMFSFLNGLHEMILYVLIVHTIHFNKDSTT